MILDDARVLIRTENMCKSCRLGNELAEAVKGLDLTIRQGEFVIIEGLKGSRKNAFFNVIGCLERPDTGKYYFDYEDIALAGADLLDSIRKNRIGYLFRDFNLINRLTAAENIEIPMHGLDITWQEKKDRRVEALKGLELEGFAAEKASNLSDFNKQLVSLARAVVNNPLMIIADEPAANLNSKEEQKLMEHLFRLNREGITIMLVASNMDMKSYGGYRLISFENGILSEDREEEMLSLLRGEGGNV